MRPYEHIVVKVTATGHKLGDRNLAVGDLIWVDGKHYWRYEDYFERLDPQPDDFPYDTDNDYDFAQLPRYIRGVHRQEKAEKLVLKLTHDVRLLQSFFGAGESEKFLKEMKDLSAKIDGLPAQLKELEGLPKRFEDFKVEMHKIMNAYARSIGNIKKLLPTIAKDDDEKGKEGPTEID